MERSAEASLLSELSRRAESFVCRWLEDRGWNIAARNFRTRRSEIDIIANLNGMTAFVEVKFASDGSRTVALEKIDREKQARIIHAASMYLSGNPPSGELRFDVAIVRGAPEQFRMETYLEDAFRPDIM